jgi:hypothetical protein
VVLLGLLVGIAVLVSSSSSDESPTAAVDFATHAFPLVAWTGDELLVYGGGTPGPDRYSNDAALIDPLTAEQVMLPRPPFDGALSGGSLLATDDAAIAVGFLCSDPVPDVENCAPGTLAAARLELENREWTQVDLPEELAEAEWGHPGLGVTSDRQAVFRFRPAVGSTFWTYDFDTGTWTSLPRPEQPVGNACLAGDRIVAVAPEASGDRSFAVLSLEEDATWERTSSTGESDLAAPRGTRGVGCMEDHAALIGRNGEFVAVHPVSADELDARWVPVDVGRSGYTHRLWTGQELIMLNFSSEEFPAYGPGLAYDPLAERLRRLDGAPVADASLVWAGDAIAGFALDADHPPGNYARRLQRFVP